jgi:transcription-repair coupling factor (superfamily II helicase)
MNPKQTNLYELIIKKTKIDLLFVEDSEEAFLAQQVFNYLKLPSTLLSDFRAEKLDDLRSYREELFDIFVAMDNLKGVLIIPFDTAKNPIPKRELLKGEKVSFGEKFPFLPENWGYFREEIVQNRGEFLVNELKIEIFPINSEVPYRVHISKSGEVEEIRAFDPISQRYSESEELDEVYIQPAYFNLSEDRREEILDDIKDYRFNSYTRDIQSFGLWFLKDSELFQIPKKAEIYNFSELPQAREIYKIELEERKKKQTYQKSNILIHELEKGDYIVHSEYGIGVFEELTRESVLGVVKDFIRIKYYGESHLLLPIENLHLISRYISATGKLPRIDKLGKGGFSKRAGKVRGKLSEIAKYIVELGAKRKLIQSPKIVPVDLKPLQRESGFRYTEDQERSIETISEALTQTYPMDHLLVGDVGFGKTEVALNGIFLLAKNGLQTAFVVPTTLLARQHFLSLRNRLSRHGVRVAHVDGFLKLKEKKAVAKEVEAGSVDLLIGTHSILDFKFKNLGLFIVDEEHKFGVKQKSKLQEAYSQTHLLSMSATPIPRTLHQALSQIKTLSRLDTPPKERKGVKTFLKDYDEVTVKEAILRELKRDGQVFYIFNSIAEIETKKTELLNIVPNIEILILHSKVPLKIVEHEIDNFVEGRYNLLLSTSIVGAGIHIPNVNTILIDGADRFGIADLHQLRGRVGRGEREGFCYLFVEDMEDLTENSEKRLIAMEENSSLGVGSSLAMHDLEIRGGGNIAGESQSGHIDEVGYSLYIQMLEREIEKLTKSGGVEEKITVDIQLKIEAFISATLVPEERVRLDLYRRVTNSESFSQLDEIEDEMFERFGKLDLETKQFFELVKIRILSERVGVKFISNMGKNISITLGSGEKVNLEAETRDSDDILGAVLEFLERF